MKAWTWRWRTVGTNNFTSPFNQRYARQPLDRPVQSIRPLLGPSVVLASLLMEKECDLCPRSTQWQLLRVAFKSRSQTAYEIKSPSSLPDWLLTLIPFAFLCKSAISLRRAYIAAIAESPTAYAATAGRHPHSPSPCPECGEAITLHNSYRHLAIRSTQRAVQNKRFTRCWCDSARSIIRTNDKGVRFG